MTKQATHRGECQLCGRVQKLPGGRLAKHGYTTRWGFFSGVCAGAHHLPYEQSCAMLVERLPSVLDSVKVQHALAAAARATTNAAWVVEIHESRSRTDRQEVRRLVPVEDLTLEDHYGAGRLTWTHSAPELMVPHYPARKEFRHGQGLTMADAVALLNEERAKDHEAHAKRLQEYADWCSARIAKWTLRELKPVDPSAEAPKSPACPKCGGHRSSTVRDGVRRCISKAGGMWRPCGHLFVPGEPETDARAVLDAAKAARS